ncbi:YggT family protein [Rarobacter incanus]|uniref:YggT family protein n=1 Tax=Rarobacter incanus TaxID=153494 RepID=A0A542SLK5_9MICO|nr:YggT family protein [Rarobacter incanus]TQK75503.1 YggT family protein [Rarobacter incanus]
MTFVWQLLSWILIAYILILFVRVGISWVQVLNRDWRPRGAMLVVAEVTFSVTDPPLKAIRKVIPDLRLGAISLDLSFMVLFFACSIALQFVSYLAAA